MPASQMLSYPLRLPDVAQADALRILDASRQVINATLVALWPRLDAFGTRESPYAYKQVGALIGPSDPHGDRQWRCEAEQAGRIEATLRPSAKSNLPSSCLCWNTA